jgi:hypothetical protein
MGSSEKGFIVNLYTFKMYHILSSILALLRFSGVVARTGLCTLSFSGHLLLTTSWYFKEPIRSLGYLEKRPFMTQSRGREFR